MNVRLSVRLLAVFSLALLVRLVPLGRYVTPDEPIWVYRSVTFRDAVAASRWADIPQTGHPGLTTMALGAAGVQIEVWLHPTESQKHLAWIRNLAWLAPENGEAFHHLGYFLPAGRLAVVFVTSLGVMLAYLLARSRLDERTARLLAVFLALDPFFAGHSSVLHTDALQATFGLLAVLTLLPRRDGRVAWRRVLAAGGWLALAGLTKTLGLLLAPGMAVALLWDRREPWGKRIAQVLLLAGATSLCYILLDPALWGDPRHALDVLTGAVSYHESIGLRPVFFAGRTTSAPGLLFYPAVLLWRLTPPVFLGLLMLRRSADRFNGWFLWPALLYLLAITLPAKKFDRYALSAIPLLSVLAARTWASLRRWRLALPLLLLPWALVAILPLYEADPLLGGPWLARHVIPLGWGETSGLGATQAARRLPHPQTAVLLTDNVPGAAPFFPGSTRAWQEELRPCADALLDKSGSVEMRWAGLPLISLTLQEPPWPSGTSLAPTHLPGLPSDAVAPITDTVALRGWVTQRLAGSTSFHWIHAPACAPLTEAQLADLLASVTDCTPPTVLNGVEVSTCLLDAPLPPADAFRARFGDDLDLLAVSCPEVAQAPDALAVQLRWRGLRPLKRHTVYLTLRAADGLIWAEGGGELVDSRTWPCDRWSVGQISDATAYLPLSLDLPPGPYTATLSLFDAQTRRLGVWKGDGSFAGTSLIIGQVTIAPAPYSAPPPSLPPRDEPFPGLHLIGAKFPDEVDAGSPLPFRLSWERTEGNPPDTLTWSLVCDGEQDGGRLTLSPNDPARWPIGHRYETRYAPRTDPHLPGGPCVMHLAVGDSPPLTLGSLVLQQRERSFRLPHAPRTPLTVTVGTFGELLGGDWPLTLTAGTDFTVTLFWQALDMAEEDYTVFVHLLGPDGQIWGQSDQPPMAGRFPTSSWVAGQVLSDVHHLSLPVTAPAGKYALYTGMYQAESGLRVPLRDERGNLLPDARVLLSNLAVR